MPEKEKVNLVVKRVLFAYRVISVEWNYTDEIGQPRVSNLYLHSDGKLKIDSETAKLGRAFGTEFLRQVFSHHDYKKAMKKKKKGPYIPSEYSRIENILRKDEMYKNALRRLNKEAAQKERPQPISLWVADDAKGRI